MFYDAGKFDKPDLSLTWSKAAVYRVKRKQIVCTSTGRRVPVRPLSAFLKGQRPSSMQVIYSNIVRRKNAVRIARFSSCASSAVRYHA